MLCQSLFAFVGANAWRRFQIECSTLLDNTWNFLFSVSVSAVAFPQRLFCGANIGDTDSPCVFIGCCGRRGRTSNFKLFGESTKCGMFRLWRATVENRWKAYPPSLKPHARPVSGYRGAILPLRHPTNRVSAEFKSSTFGVVTNNV